MAFESSRRASRGLALALLALGAAAPARAEDPFGEPMDSQGAEFSALLTGVEAAGERLRDGCEQLSVVYQQLKGLPETEEKRAAMEASRRASGRLEATESALERLLQLTRSVTRPEDVFKGLKEASGRLDKDRLGQVELAADLARVASAVGPDAGRVLAGLAGLHQELVAGLAETLERVVGDLDQRAGMGAVGKGAGPGPASGLDAALREQFPALAGAHRFLPQTPSWLYSPSDAPGPQLLWSAAKGRWYEVPAGVDAVEVYRLNLLAGRHPSPEQLLSACQRWQESRKRLDAARQILSELSSARTAPGAFAAFWDAYFERWETWSLLRDHWEDEEAFAARYAFNSRFQWQVRELLGSLCRGLAKRGGEEAVRVERLRALGTALAIPQLGACTAQ